MIAPMLAACEDTCGLNEISLRSLMIEEKITPYILIRGKCKLKDALSELASRSKFRMHVPAVV